MDFHVEQAFWTPIVVDGLPDAQALNDELERIILEVREREPGIRRANVGGWHSETDMSEWGGPSFDRLLERVFQLASANTVKRSEDRGWKVTAWANVGERGSYITPHAHGGCYWSAIYYVRVDPGDGGELIVHDPRMPMLDMHAPDYSFRYSGGERRITMAPVAGRLLLIPAWLMHSVSAWEGDGLRISVAMNLAAKR